jgi:hypothetical protein
LAQLGHCIIYPCMEYALDLVDKYIYIYIGFSVCILCAHNGSLLIQFLFTYQNIYIYIYIYIYSIKHKLGVYAELLNLKRT